MKPIRAGQLMEKDIRFQFAVYYLPTATKDPLAEVSTELKTRFQEFRQVKDTKASTVGKVVSPRLLTKVKEGYAPPSPESLRYSGRGLSKEQVAAVQNSEAVLLLDFAYHQKHVWDGMRAALKLTSSVARATNGLIWDEETRELFTPDFWDERRIADWKEEVPAVSKHTVLHAYNTGEYVRGVTLGMAKFGLPDVVIDQFSWSLSRNIGHLINLFGQAIAEGATVKEGGEFDLDLRRIQNSEVREPQVTALESHATSVALLLLREGVREEGDPNNRLIEITFDRYPGPDVHSKQVKMLGDLFGWKDSKTLVKDNDEVILEASRRAQRKLPAVQAAFNAGLAPGEFICVKAPFKTPNGSPEWMWVEVTSWKGETIKGLLQNEPFDVPGLHSGQVVEVSQKIVFDYIQKHADGTREGNETGKIMEKQR